MRDPEKLQAFQTARVLALQVYRITATFPAEERFGLAIQMRRAAVSIGSNIAEGSSRSSLREYIRFLEIAHGSAKELQFQTFLARELGFIADPDELSPRCEEAARLLAALTQSLRELH